MNRRSFINWMGLGWLANSSPTFIISVLFQLKQQLVPKTQSISTTPATFYVAPNGNDNWTGKQANPNETKIDGPFATLERARNAIRELKDQQGATLNQPVTVLIKGGT